MKRPTKRSSYWGSSPLWRCARHHGKELREAGRFQREVEERTVERFLQCGDPHYGFARIYCDACGHEGIGESIRPRSLKGPPARRNPVLESRFT